MWIDECTETEVAQSCPTLRASVDSRLPGFSVHAVFQARILAWVAISYSKGSSQPSDQPGSPALVDEFFTTVPLGKSIFVYIYIRLILLMVLIFL